MKMFILGIIVAIVVIGGGILFYAETGRVSMRADIPPSGIETTLAGRAMDASVARHAPKVKNPLQPTQENLIGGATVYLDHCSLCHGDPSTPESRLAKTLNPPPPQFFNDDEPDMPEEQNYYITVHGIRWTGMPGWKNVLSDHDIWQTVTFLSHIDNLPPQVKSVFGLAAQPKAATPTKKQ